MPETYESVERERNKYKQQRDELLEALRWVVRLEDSPKSAVNKAREAIAKVEAEK